MKEGQQHREDKEKRGNKDRGSNE